MPEYLRIDIPDWEEYALIGRELLDSWNIALVGTLTFQYIFFKIIEMFAMYFDHPLKIFFMT